MAWLESHQTLRDHPKTMRASKLLGISRQQLIGHLMFLWWWAMDYSQDGDLSAYAPDELESVMAWDGEPGALYTALINCRIDDKHAGFLEKIGSKVYIHDWDEYAGKLIDRRREDAERKRQERRSRAPIQAEDIPDDIQDMSTGCPTDVHTPSLVENSTQHNTTQQTQHNTLSDTGASERSPNSQNALPQRQKSQRATVLAELEKEFARVSGLPLPPRRTASDKTAAAKRWWNPLWQIYDVTSGADLTRAKSVVGAAIVKMRKDGLTISAPQSIANIAASIVASGNGNGVAQSPIDRATAKTLELLRNRQNGNG